MSKVSIIVPVYNVEKYLAECLDSILNQTFQDIEIICVNDASPDNSYLVLEEYSKRDSRIRIFTHQQNGGLGAARNTGLEHVSSMYVSFVDSDDTLEPTFIETLVKILEENNADLGWCGDNTIDEESNFVAAHPIIPGVWSVSDVLNKEELYPSILPVWNKLFKFEYIKDIKQLPIISEDQPALAEYFCKCKVIATSDKNLYNYRTNSNTLSRPIAPKPKFWNDFFYSHELFFEILRVSFPKKNQLRKQAILRYFSLLWRIINFNMLMLNNWHEHESVIKGHVKLDKIGLKKYSPLMYVYIWVIFSFRLNKRIKRYLIKTGIILSKNRWLKNDSFWLFPIDLFKLSVPSIKLILKKTFDSIEISFCKVISLFHKIFNPYDIWIIGERPDTAQENGIYFFRYLKTIENIKAYYIIDKNCEQFYSIENYKQSIIHYNSFKHKVIFLRSKYYVNSHYNSCFPLTRFGRRLYPQSNITKNIFLQHGITYADVSPYYGKLNSSINLFICGAKPEYEYVINNFGFNNNEVALTGFARFDGLYEGSPQKIILYMPTWRRNLDTITPEDFIKTSYYKKINTLLRNQDLLKIIQDAGYSLVFFPHYQLLKFLHLFDVDERIIIPNKNTSVQQLLINSALLITDVSSVHFDFAYMYKPIIYYIWDYEQIIVNHLAKGYYSHKNMGFGPVLENDKELVTQLQKMINRNFTIEDNYRNKIDSFFTLHDRNNCERIYSAIISLKQ